LGVSVINMDEDVIFITETGMTTTYKGRYCIKNPKKYRGDITKIFYRSSWELKFMVRCDTDSSILEWGSETVIIPYVSPVDDKMHRYFVDFYMKVRNKDGIIQEYLIEVKPKSQTQPPVKSAKRTSKKFLQEVMTYGVNQAKWEAAEKYCARVGWKFQILTEIELNV